MSTLKATNIQHASAADPAIVLATNGSATANLSSINSGQLAGMRNKIINGAMEISQRGTSFAAVAHSTYTIDRFQWQHSGAMVVTITQSTDVPNDTFQSSYKVDVTTADASIAAGEYALIAQYIEGYNVRDLIGQTFTLSFWVKSPKTGTHCVSFRNSIYNRSYIMEYTVSVANTWEYKTLTVTGGLITAGTWNWTNGVGLTVIFTLTTGSTFQTTAGAWQTGNFLGTSNQVNCMDSTANDFFLTGVQLEVGPTATEFERRSIGQELALCQRYYQITAQAGGGNSPIAFCFQFSTTSSRAAVPLTVTMRTNPPILDLTGTPTLNDSSGVGVTLSSIIVNSGIVSNNSNTVGLVATTASRTAGPVGAWAGLNLKLAFDAEF